MTWSVTAVYLRMSTDSLLQRLKCSCNSGNSTDNISAAEELELLAQIKKEELASCQRHVERKQELKACRKRISELEKALNSALEEISELKRKRAEDHSTFVAPVHEEESEIEPPRQRWITEIKMTESKYVSYLERFSEMKCNEVDQLVARLLKQREKNSELRQKLSAVENSKREIKNLRDENEHLKNQLAKLKRAVRQFAVCHRENKADRRTRELQELAEIRAACEEKDVSLYAFILDQLRPLVDGQYDVTEESVRKLITKAAETLKSNNSVE